MRIDVRRQGAFGSVLVHLEANETFLSEAGAMYRASEGVDIDVTTRTRGGSGLFSSLKRMLANESFFLSTYRAPPQGGEVGLAPTLQGDVRQVDLEPGRAWTIVAGKFLACGPQVSLETRYEGVKGVVGGSSLFYLRAEGSGPLLVTSFGGLTAQELDGELIVDTGHLVAYEEGLEVSVTKAGGSWRHSVLGGEGLVMRFRGSGQLITQSHQEPGFGRALGRLLPPRRQ